MSKWLFSDKDAADVDGDAGGGGSADLTPSSSSFSNQTSVTVNHDLGYKPNVWLVDADGYVVFSTIRHLNDNSFTVSFANPQSGVVYYR